MERLPFTARRREGGSKLSKMQELFLNVLRAFFMPDAAEQSNFYTHTHTRTFAVVRLLGGSVNVCGGGAARRLRGERVECEAL